MMKADNILVDVRDLSVDFSQGETVTHAVRNVSFHVDKGETVAIVGESGSGKTVSALSIMQLLQPGAASHPSGTILFEGNDLTRESIRCLIDNAHRTLPQFLVKLVSMIDGSIVFSSVRHMYILSMTIELIWIV